MAEQNPTFRCAMCGCEADLHDVVQGEDGCLYCRACHGRRLAAKYISTQSEKAVLEDFDPSEETAVGEETADLELAGEDEYTTSRNDSYDDGAISGAISKEPLTGVPLELRKREERQCPACQAWLDHGVDKCPYCGYSYSEAAEKALGSSAYSVAGSRGFDVDELERVRLRALRRKWKHQRKYVFLLILGGLALSYGFLNFTPIPGSIPTLHELSPPRESMIQYGMQFFLSLIIGVIALKKCTDVWLGKASALDQTALRLAAVLAVGDLVLLTGEAYLMPFSGWFLMIIAYVYLLGQFFNLAWAQAVILAFVALLVKVMGFSLSILLLAAEQRIEAAMSIYWK